MKRRDSIAECGLRNELQEEPSAGRFLQSEIRNTKPPPHFQQINLPSLNELKVSVQFF